METLSSDFLSETLNGIHLPGIRAPVPVHLDYGEVVSGDLAALSSIKASATGHVWKVTDLNTSKIFAIKIALYPGNYKGSGRAVAVSTVAKRSGDPAQRFIALAIQSFLYRSRHVVLFDLYGKDLGELIKHGSVFPLPTRHMQAISWQLIAGLEFIHSLGFIHTDVKPSNIVLVKDDTTVVFELGSNGFLERKTLLVSPEIKIIDLDDCVPARPRKSSCIGTRCYRPPEAFAGLEWSYSADVYAAGSTMFELYTGDTIVRRYKTTELVLYNMEQAIEAFPSSFARAIESVLPGTFVRGKNQISVASFRDSVPTDIRRLKDRVSNTELRDLLKRMVSLNPTTRLSMSNVKSHRYFKKFTSG